MGAAKGEEDEGKGAKELAKDGDDMAANATGNVLEEVPDLDGIAMVGIPGGIHFDEAAGG